MTRLTSLAESLPATVPFVGPETQERARGIAFAARLGANESVFGPSPRAVDAMATAAGDAWMYGDPEMHDLRAALAQHHDVPPEAIMCGEGIDGLLGTLVRLLAGPGDAVVTSAGAYPTFNYHVAGFGAALHTVPYHQDREDLDALCAKARDVGAKLVYLANPDNPMGTWWRADAVAALLDALPRGTLLCLDEAYVDFAPADAVMPFDVMDGRVIRMRTFSKAYGLAGARVGYALGTPELIAAFNRVRNHFGVGRVSQAGALAALKDQAWLTQVVVETATARQRLDSIARAHGLATLPSATNFVAIDCQQDGAFARRVLAELLARGVFARMPAVAPLDRCVRIGAGAASDLDAFEAALGPALSAAAEAS
ncbi:MAG: pyridoxal phosphate-dependent aminotransferase [Pseudomonadota bacterium]